MELTKENEQELIRLKQYFPFRVVFGVKYDDGKFESYAMNNRRKMNSFVKQGLLVVEVK